jgi:ribose transport system substrate-binding protein
VAPKDAQKALSGATATARSYYNGWPFPLQKSALGNWKPKGKAPYTVGILFDGLSNPFQAYVFNLMQKFLNRSPMIDKVIGVVSEAGNPTKEVQNYQSLVQQGADLIIVQPSSAPAFLPVVKDALKQGVATVAYINPLSDASAVSVGPNVYTSSGAAFAALLKQKGGKGNLLGVHGIRVTPVDQSTWAIYKQLLSACPDVKLVGEIDGNFAPPAVRAAVLQFLATYPGQVDGVFHTAVMGPSIIGAFQQAGRSVPSVTAMAAQKGDLAYWADNAAKGYQTTGFAGGPTAITNLITRVTLRLLAGQGAKVSDIPWPQPQITPANYKQYAKEGWTLTTPGTVEQPRSTHWAEKDLDSLFNHPEKKTGGF